MKKNLRLPDVDENLRTIFSELDNTLVNLLNNEINNFDIEESIGSALVTFENMRGQKNNFFDGSASINLIYKTSNNLTKEYDSLTLKYSELSYAAR